MLRSVAALLFLSLSALAATIKTDLGTYPLPALPLMGPAASKVVDPTFGTTILRITDFANSGSSYCKSGYHYHPSFNQNGTRVLATCNGWMMHYNFDPVNFTASGGTKLSASPDGGGVYGFIYWADKAGSDVDDIYATSNSTDRLYKHNVRTDAWTLIFDPVARGALTGGDHLEQMGKSGNDDCFAWWRSNSARGSAGKGFVVYKQSTNQFISMLFTPANGDTVNEVGIDKSCTYLSIVGNSYPNTWVMDMSNFTSPVISPMLSDGFSHKDWGTKFVVSMTVTTPHTVVKRMGSTPDTILPLLGGINWSHEFGASMHADNEAWAMIYTQNIGGAYGGTPGVAAAPFEEEILQVATDGSRQVRRLAHHRSLYTGYDSSAEPNISRDGRYVAFTSNWGNTLGRTDLFVVQIPPAPADVMAPAKPTGLRLQ